MLSVSVIVEIICFLLSLATFKKNDSWAWISFRLYLLVVCVIELIGSYLKAQHHVNQWPYNILLIFQITFTCYFFNNLFVKYLKSKPIITIVIIGFFILVSLYIYQWISGSFYTFYELTYNVMTIVFIMYSLHFFYLLQKDNQYIDLKLYDHFWWVFGVFAFYFGSTAVNIFRGKLHIMINNKHYLTYYINMVLNIILYSCWSYSFICRKWLTSKSLSS